MRTTEHFRSSTLVLTLAALLGLPTPSSFAENSGDWLAHGRTAAEQRYSPLETINDTNVANMMRLWTFDTGTTRGLEATPIVKDGVMYTTLTWSVVLAIDARTGTLIWRYDPKVPKSIARKACCDVVNRGVAVHDGRVFVGTLDGRLIALDARDGSLQWEVVTVDQSKNFTITGAPRIVKDKVIIGNGGAEFGVRGYVSAYDTKTGKQVWRTYTVPGNPADGFETKDMERAAKTWNGEWWKLGGGGTVWDSMAYDPDLDLLYVGTGNGTPWTQVHRSPGGGDNLYLSSILALDPSDGHLVWHYQTTPGETWDFTATQHIILADLKIEGRERKVLMQAPKNGFFYVLDRATGELLGAEKFVHVSWASRVDLDSGRPIEREEALWSNKDAVVSPAPPGGHNWQPMSFHPGTGLVYIPAIESAYAYLSNPDFRFRPGVWNTGEDFTRLHEMAEDYTGAQYLPCGLMRLIAWDPIRQEKAWEVRHDSGVPGGTLATAGGLVFQGIGQGRLAAFDASTGALLWASEIGIDVMAPPVTYRVDGEQYIVVLAGVGGSFGNHYTAFDHDNAGRVLGYKLDGKAAMPRVQLRPTRKVSWPRLDVPPDVIRRGRQVYAETCFTCHGIGLQSSGVYPDLRTASAETHEQWDAIVRGGIRTQKGMPSFADVVSADDARAVHAYVLDRAWHEAGILEKALDLFVEHACIPVSWMTD